MSATAVVFCGSFAAVKTFLRPFLSRSSAKVTIPIMREYACLAVSPKVKMPCFNKISPCTDGSAS